MSGRAVLTMDRERIGRIVDEFGDYFVVECGALRKSRHALPKVLAHEDDHAVIVVMGKNMIADSPKLPADVAQLEAYWG